jgi:hypothetical protein
MILFPLHKGTSKLEWFSYPLTRNVPKTVMHQIIEGRRKTLKQSSE